MNALFPGAVSAFAAGSHPKGLDPMAVRVMAEAGVDISGQRSTGLDTFAGQRFDWVVTVCGQEDACPAWLEGGRKIHHSFDDPPHLAKGAATEDDALAVYRRVREEIREFVAGYPRSFQAADAQNGISIPIR